MTLLSAEFRALPGIEAGNGKKELAVPFCIRRSEYAIFGIFYFFT